MRRWDGWEPAKNSNGRSGVKGITRGGSEARVRGSSSFRAGPLVETEALQGCSQRELAMEPPFCSWPRSCPPCAGLPPDAGQQISGNGPPQAVHKGHARTDLGVI